MITKHDLDNVDNNEFKESERFKTVRELTKLSEDMGGYNNEFLNKNPLIREDAE